MNEKTQYYLYATMIILLASTAVGYLTNFVVATVYMVMACLAIYPLLYFYFREDDEADE